MDPSSAGRGCERYTDWLFGCAIAMALVVAGPHAFQEKTGGCPGESQPPLTIGMGASACHTAVRLKWQVLSEPETGTRIAATDASSPLAAAGLQAGDVVYKVAGEFVPNAETLAKRLQAVADTSDIVINFERGGSPLLVRVRR